MKLKKSRAWHTGSGNRVDFSEIYSDIVDHNFAGGKVYIGSDSQIHGDSCTFVTAICLHGGSKKTSRYYFSKTCRVFNHTRESLRTRISEEVSHALDVFLNLSENIPDLDVEIHIDIGNTERSKTRSLVDSITGWVKGFGVAYKIKPDAWASAAVADKHTK
tara:strand:- start:221 stop:703 length:483 start_codon:yes stop_codon:yes gene_type:complete